MQTQSSSSRLGGIEGWSGLKPPAVLTQAPPSPPVLPASWQATALLHPFSPPPENDPTPDSPFFQLCIATVGFIEDVVMSVQITGLSYGTWWFKVMPEATVLSTDEGSTWQEVDMGWSLPSTQWLTAPTFFATSCLNWMEAQQLDWWKQAVPKSNATTWFWFTSGDSTSGLPFRLMFGAPPPSPVYGDPGQLALFQNFSFTYFPSFFATPNPAVDTWSPPVIPGFQAGNPAGYKLVIWNGNFGMTTLMTPVDSASFPLPTVVFYEWKPDDAYQVLTDRAQSTVMQYDLNPASPVAVQQALMFGAAPPGIPPPPHSGASFLYTLNKDQSEQCQPMALGAEPPDWAYVPAVDGVIHACVTDNPTLCPEQTVTIISVTFPPSDEYPQGRYLWTWYSPFPGSDGTHARPVTFMESASTIAEGGTSLALADYFDYKEFTQPIDPATFVIPGACLTPGDASDAR
jgi:hypothetical protein